MHQYHYRQLAQRILQQIDAGALQPDNRLPSVRALARSEGVSVGTVVQAYQYLENQGWIHARPRSGYYVSERPANLPLPSRSESASPPSEVSLGHLAMEVVRASSHRQLAQMGPAFASMEFPGCRDLQRRLSARARRLHHEHQGYETPPGDERLRRLICQRAMASRANIHPDELLITTGCQEAITLCLQVLTGPGDMVAVESPVFYGILQVIEALKLKVIEIPCNPQSGIDLDALEQACQHWPLKACLLSPTVNNPLGSVMPEANRHRLMQLLRRYQLPVIEDDVFGELSYGDKRPVPLKALDDQGLVLWCSSVSKTLDPGLRVGWVAGGRYAEALSYRKFLLTMASPSLNQLALADYLEQERYDRHLKLIRDHYQRRRDRALSLVSRHFPAQTRATHPQGGFLLWLELPEEVDALQLYRHALAAGISLAPGPLFSARSRYHHHIRLNYAHGDQPWFKDSIKKLGELICLSAPDS